MDWDAIKRELQRPLDPKNVKPAPRGKFGEYVDGYHVVTEANRIFGENGWSYTVTRLEKVSEQTVQLKGRDGPYEQYRVGYLATVRADVGGVIREGCAVGSGVGSPLTIADHHESAVKEAETDALKRALRCFGNTFGLALYEKEKSQVRSEAPAATPPQEGDVSPYAMIRDALLAGIAARTTEAALRDYWDDERDARIDLKANDAPKYREVVAAFEKAGHAAKVAA